MSHLATIPVTFSGPKKSMMIDGYSLYLDDVLVHIGTIEGDKKILLSGCDITVQSFGVEIAFKDND